MTGAPHVVGIVVDPSFGERIEGLLDRLPVWMADTEANRAAATRVWAARKAAGQSTSHTAVGALTTFRVDPDATPESWCIDVMGTVAGHHDRYSHSPGYSGVEVYGVAESPILLEALAEYRLTAVTAVPGGFRASTRDGEPAASPNDDA